MKKKLSITKKTRRIFGKNFTSKGFTLIEMIVAMGLFAVFAGITTDIFLSTVKSQKNLMIRQKLISEARYATELMVRNARIGTVSYGDYSSGDIDSSPEDELFLKDIDEKKIWFKLGDSGGGDPCPAGITKCLLMSLDSGSNWYSVTSSDTEVDSLNFYILPSSDPFSDLKPDIQPHIEIILKIQNKNNPDINLSLQSLASTRIYKR